MGIQIMRYGGYAATIFAGAFLIFVVEPIVGKQLLPLFGGSSSVWAASLLFFTTVLFLGYVYVWALTKQDPRRQVVMHVCTIVACVALSLASFLSWGLLVPAGVFSSVSSPYLQVLLVLVVSVGPAFFLLSTTSPLLQYWFAATGEGEPYALYALSNAGSFLALIAYPLIVEPLVPLSTQTYLWFAGFVLCAGALAVIGYRTGVGVPSSAPAQVTRTSIVAWIAYAALPSFVLIATTTQITQVLAPVPLLWVVPLALYLITLVAAFAGYVRSIFIAPATLAAAGAVYFLLQGGSLMHQFLAYGMLLTLWGLACHGRLYELRPAPSGLPLFYLAVSFGGAFGVLCGSILPPLFFVDIWEFPIAVALAAGTAVWLFSLGIFPRAMPERAVPFFKLACIMLFALVLAGFLSRGQTGVVFASRDFYGAFKVVDSGDALSLMHGSILHGMQFKDKERSLLPTTYFSPQGGVGRALLFERDQVRKAKDLRVGVIGLGIGTLAAYCRSGDTYVFYEIDPAIAAAAQKYFSYLSHCSGAQVRVGDGRLLLKEEQDAQKLGAYDLLVMDAFNGDTVPVHLLTKEAFELYHTHLRGPSSIIAVNVTNAYVDLAPIVLREAQELNMSAILVKQLNGSSEGATASSWVLLSDDPSIFEQTPFVHLGLTPAPSSALWTDEYTSLFPILRAR